MKAGGEASPSIGSPSSRRGTRRGASASPAKGDIAVGYDADLALLDPTRRFVVQAAESPSSQGYTPFEGQELTGQVQATFLRGHLIYERGAVVGPPRGRFVRRPAPPS